jgi:hypothetical protein
MLLYDIGLIMIRHMLGLEVTQQASPTYSSIFLMPYRIEIALFGLQVLQLCTCCDWRKMLGSSFHKKYVQFSGET